MRELPTSFGPVPLWGRYNRPDRPLLFIIRGLFPQADQLNWAVDAFPQLDVALAHLPGMFSPFMPEPSVARFGAAFDEVLEVLGHRDVAVIGLSVGGLVAMSLRTPALREILAFDVMLDTRSLWPLHAFFLFKGADDVRLQDLLFRLGGVTPQGILKRDYRGLLEGLHTPVRLLVGDDRLGEPGPRDSILPSLVSEADLALYRAEPRVRVSLVAGSGHDIAHEAPEAFRTALTELADSLLKGRAP